MSNLAIKAELRALKYLRNVNEKKISESIDYIKSIHRNDDGFITIGVKDEEGNFYQWNYAETEIIKEDAIQYFHSLRLNTYASINSFFIPVRNTNNIRRINALYIDIDNHKDKVSKEMIVDLIKHLEGEYYNKLIPKPSITVSTGRGIQLVMLLEHLPKQGLKFWQNIENEMVKRLEKLDYKGFKVDVSCTDVTRVFRIGGTYNTNSKSYCEVLEINDNVYRLDQLKKDYFKYVPKTTRKRKNKIINITSGQIGLNTYELHWKRREDIERLQDLREGDCEGLREVMCFLYRYYTCLIDGNCKKAIDKMLKFNQKFSEPLPLHEVIKATESAEKGYKAYLESLNSSDNTKVYDSELKAYNLKGYNYTNAKLIRILKVTEEEQREGNLLILISKEEKYRRNNIRRTPRNEEGLTKKQQELEELKERILELKEQGLSLRKIAEKLEITLGKVQRCIKK
ncbi:MAG: hypothetical protein ACRDDY_16200 [Clostridium sp.]|uniref:hypothetical protein n=1 Tax=Clostridium sp. TaxID=1506 RepID=UPI003EE6B2B3